MEILIRQIDRLQRTLAADWDDLFIRDDQRHLLGMPAEQGGWKNPFPIFRLIEELGHISTRREVTEELFKLANGSDGIVLSAWLTEVLYSKLPYDEPVESGELNIRVALIFAISGCQMAATYFSRSEFQDALRWFGYAKQWQGSHYEAIHQEKKRAQRATRHAKKRWANDPILADKLAVFECWKLWQDKPSRYVGPTAFSRDMLEKFEHLGSQEVVMRWCREWKKAMTQRAE